MPQRVTHAAQAPLLEHSRAFAQRPMELTLWPPKGRREGALLATPLAVAARRERGGQVPRRLVWPT